MELTLEQIKQISPRMARNPNTCAKLLPHLNQAMEEAEINTPERVAAFLAQILHESGEFKYMKELWGPTPAQARYEPPSTLATRLGNTQKGDGARYMGRGIIQLTGRYNYRKCGEALGIDLEGNPELAETPEYAFKTATWYWNSRNLNELADSGDFVELTKKINGGFNGLQDRQKYWAKAKQVLGC